MKKLQNVIIYLYMARRGRPKTTSELADLFIRGINESDKFDFDWDQFYYREKNAAERYALSLAPEESLLDFDTEKEATKYLKKKDQWAVMLFFPDFAKVRWLYKYNVLVRKTPYEQLFFITGKTKEDEIYHPGYKFYKEFKFKPTRAFFTNIYDAAMFIYSCHHYETKAYDGYNKIKFIERTGTKEEVDAKFVEIYNSLRTHKYKEESSDRNTAIDNKAIRAKLKELSVTKKNPSVKKVKRIESELTRLVVSCDDKEFIKEEINELIKSIESYSLVEIGKQQIKEYREQDRDETDAFIPIKADIKSCCNKNRAGVRGFVVVPIGKFPVVKKEYRDIILKPDDDLNWTLY